MTKTVQSILALSALVGVVFGAKHYMDAEHEPRGVTDAGIGAVFLFLKSQNQNIRNHYLQNIENGEMVEESEKQLQRLEYEQQYIDMVQQKIGVRPDE